MHTPFRVVNRPMMKYTRQRHVGYRVRDLSTDTCTEQVDVISVTSLRLVIALVRPMMRYTCQRRVG